MQDNTSKESVDAIRQILFGQTKIEFEDRIAQLNKKIEALVEQVDYANQDYSAKLFLLEKNWGDKLSLIQNQISTFQTLLKSSEQHLKTEIADAVNNANLKNQQLIEKVMAANNDKNNALERDLAANFLSRDQLGAVFSALGAQIQRTESKK